MEKFNNYIKYLKLNNIDKTQALELLKGDSKLTPDEKNLIFAYCYPRTLLDKELPGRVQDYREKHGIPNSGLLSPNLGEITLILEAGQTEQYGRFIKHLMHSFCKDPDEKIITIVDNASFDCCICGKLVDGLEKWEKLTEFGDKDINKETLAFSSKDTSVVICLDCLTQLLNAYEAVQKFDPGFLDWTQKIK